MLQTKHLTILFFRPKFILLVNIFSTSVKIYFANPILLLMSYLTLSFLQRGQVLAAQHWGRICSAQCETPMYNHRSQ